MARHRSTIPPAANPAVGPAVALALALVVVAVTVVVVRVGAGSPDQAITPSAASARPTDTAAVAVLRAWDRRRAAAYAAASVVRLRDLYLPGSRAGAADLRILQGYRSRGYRVLGLRTQVLAASVLSGGPGRWRLRVTDRLQAAAAVAGGRRVDLPRDRATTRTVTLVRGADARWRVSEVR